jgi:hypothetical protein
MDVGIRRLAVGKLECRDTQGPDVSLVIVAALLDHFWRHPEWGAHKGVLLGHGRRELARDTKVGQFDLAVGREKDIRRYMAVSI